MELPAEQAPAKQTPAQLTKRDFQAVLLSVALHGSVLGLVLVVGTAVRTKVVQPPSSRMMALMQTAGGSHAVKIELPAKDFAAHTRETAPDPEATKKTMIPVEKTHPRMAGGGAPKTPHAGDGPGQALRGNGSDAEEVHPAFPIFSPHPPVTDRSLLPATEEKVVVDVKVDALGQVVSETLVKGVSAKLDRLCLDIVKTWRFQPATVNGKPVASEAELIFPFTPSYPITETSRGIFGG
jgi:protein TonB